ncbi:MAG: hypothetical protein SNJ71_03495, partial [Bacteroidales bacterium]
MFYELRKYLLFLVLFLTAFLPAFSQISEDDLENLSEKDLNKLLIQEVKLKHPVYKPIIGGGIGVIRSYGEVRNKYLKDFSYGDLSFNIDIIRTINPKFKFGFRFIYGSMTEIKYDLDPLKNLNF